MGCGGGNSTSAPPVSTPPPTPPPTSGPPTPDSPVSFTDVAVSNGLVFSSGYHEDYQGMPRFFAGGVASGDVDNDGDIDLFITPGDLHANRLYLNDGSGRFTDGAPGAGLEFLKSASENYKFSGPLLADFDGDGHLDLFIGGIDGDPSLLFKNNGDGTYTDISATSGLSGMTSLNTISSAAGDYDGDGDLDLILAHWGTPRIAANPGDTETLWRNDTSGGVISFTSVSVSAGIASELKLSLDGVKGPDHDYTFAPSFSDIDNDGVMDILMVGDFTGSQIFMGKGDGTFENVTDDTQINDKNGMGSATGDYDNDLDSDWFVSSTPPNRLYENMNGVMIHNSDAEIDAGSWGWGSCFADFDMDGNLDIYHTNGWVDGQGATPDEPFTEDRSRLFMNNGDKTFEELAEGAGINDDLQGRGVVCADFNGDRQVDILLTLYEADQAALLWINDNEDANTLAVKLNGIGANSQGLGAKIIVTQAGQSQMRTVNLNSNYISHNPAMAYFGFENSGLLDELKVIWPDGQETVQTNVAVNQSLTIAHPDLP